MSKNDFGCELVYLLTARQSIRKRWIVE